MQTEFSSQSCLLYVTTLLKNKDSVLQTEKHFIFSATFLEACCHDDQAPP